MSNPRQKGRIPDEAKLGFAFLLAIIIFVYGLFFLKDIRIGTGTYLLKASFKDLAGVKRSDPVLLGGVRVGKVDRIGLEGLQPTVWLRMDEEYQLPVDSYADVVSRSVMGEMAIEVHRGTKPTFITENGLLEGRSSKGLNTILSSADSITTSLEALLANANTLIDAQSRTSIKTSLGNVQELTGNLNQTVKDERQQIHKIVKDMNALVNTMQEISTSERGKLSTTLGNLEKSSTDLKELTTKLQHTTNTLDSILQKMDRGEGTLGKLMNDDKLYTDANKLMTSMDELVNDLKKNPKKYFSVSIF